MNNLSQKNQELISRGLRACGRSMDAYFYIEEELYVDEAQKIYEFFEWLFKIDRPYGPANAQERWKEFISGEQPPAEYFDFVYERMSKLPGSSHASLSQNKQRMVEVSLEHAGLIMYKKNRDLPWKFYVVNQDGKVVKKFTKKAVYSEMDKLDSAWDGMTMDERMAFHEKRDQLGYRY